MELRSVKENEVRKYPKINEVGTKKLKKFIPSKWTKVGVSSFVMGLFLSRKMSLATAREINFSTMETPIHGGETSIVEAPIIHSGLYLSIIGIVCCVINIILIKLGNRKKDEGNKKKLNNVVKTFLIIFIVIAIVCGGILVLSNIFDIYIIDI